MKPRIRRRELDAHRAEARRKRLVLWSGIFMIFLMIFSFASVILYSPTSQTQMEYGDYEFRLRMMPELGPGAGVYITEVDGREVEFQNLPIHVGYLEVDPAAVALMRNAPSLALAAEPGLDEERASFVDYARYQLSMAIPKAYPALSAPDPRYQLPVMNCSQASPQIPVLYFNMTNETAKVTAQGGCIVLHGDERNLMRLKDRIIFEYLGILQDGEVVED